MSDRVVLLSVFMSHNAGHFQHYREATDQSRTPARKMVKADQDRSFYFLPVETPICSLDCKKAFEGLTSKERLYAHYVSQASWNGSLIVLQQLSAESPLIFILLQRLFERPVEEVRTLAVEKCGFSDDEFTKFLIYAAGFLGNNGNYKTFGDTKIVPDLEPEKFKQLVLAANVEDGEKLWSLLGTKLFSLDGKEKSLGFPDVGTTAYLSSNVTKADSDKVNAYLKAKGIEAWNTRLFKTVSASGIVQYDIRLASVAQGVVVGPEDFQGDSFVVTRGDYAPLLQRVIDQLTLAQNFAANNTQEAMLSDYVKHFANGNIDDHKNGSRCWVKDRGPAVESYIGFIENYRDPAGVRSEFEGFVSCVNREMTKKFTALVDRSQEFIAKLPWTKEYEKDNFLAPDFTSLDVITFASAGIPIGINIPNYDEIRQNEGFKNVSLGNVMSAMPKIKMIFLSQADDDLAWSKHVNATEVQVGLHELLGHGCGKLFQRSDSGEFNFDVEHTKHLLTGEKVSSWYEPGETWSSKFGPLASAYEECRAEAVGYFLCTFPDVLKIFGYEGDEAEDVMYVNWLCEIRAGLLSLEFYSPETKTWGQAHCHARYVLLRVVQEAGRDFVKIEDRTGDDGKPDLLFSLDRTKIESVGKPAVAEFLKKLQAYKSTGDFAAGKALFEKYGAIGEQQLTWRQICIDRRQPRKLFVQPNTVVQGEGKDVKLLEYPTTPEGIIDSFRDRFKDPKIYEEMFELWTKDKDSFGM